MGRMHLKIDEMIQSEDTGCRYEAWSEYRKELTDLIIDCVEHYHIKHRLKMTGSRRLADTYTIENIISELSDKPVLAIWGAGGCNDIDILRLSKYFRLVLIDRDVKKLTDTRSHFNLSEDECICIDLNFWDIKDDDYRNFERMLLKGDDISEIEDYLTLVIDGFPMNDYKSLPKFDYSVVVGVSSQLNVRFAVLASLYDKYEELSHFIYELNVKAVERMFAAACDMTKGLILWGYEQRSARSEAELKELQHSINEDNGISYERIFESDIAGSDVLEKILRNSLKRENDYCLLCDKAMIWPFEVDKFYLMRILALEKLAF